MCVCINKREASGTVRLQGVEVEKVPEFKYLGTNVWRNRECVKEMKRVQAGCSGWRKVSGVIYDERVAVKVKGNVYKRIEIPAICLGWQS